MGWVPWVTAGRGRDPRGSVDRPTVGSGHDLARARGWATPAGNLSHGGLSLSGR
jgi:hypothetical protein